MQRDEKEGTNMAINDFWLNVQTAARLLSPQNEVDNHRSDSIQAAQGLQRTPAWLTPRSIRGFAIEDFKFLDDLERTKLANAVSRFQEIARQVPPNRPPSTDQVEMASKALLQILEVLQPERYADPEAFECGKRIERYLAGQLPATVSEIRFRTDDDFRGQPGLWIWVIFKDDFESDQAFLDQVDVLRRLLYSATNDLGIDRWPYTRFTKESELAEDVEALDVTSR